MTRIDFYHLQKSTVEEALPKILEKDFASGKKILIKVGTEDRVEFLNTALWGYDEQSFLPHGSKKDGNAEMQPIWLTSGEDNPNNAVLLFLTDGASVNIKNLGAFERVLNLFDGNSEESLSQARAFWKEVKAEGMECFYWQQDDNGAWKQKA